MSFFQKIVLSQYQGTQQTKTYSVNSSEGIRIQLGTKLVNTKDKKMGTALGDYRVINWRAVQKLMLKN